MVPPCWIFLCRSQAQGSVELSIFMQVLCSWLAVRCRTFVCLHKKHKTPFIFHCPSLGSGCVNVKIRSRLLSALQDSGLVLHLTNLFYVYVNPIIKSHIRCNILIAFSRFLNLQLLLKKYLVILAGRFFWGALPVIGGQLSVPVFQFVLLCCHSVTKACSGNYKWSVQHTLHIVMVHHCVHQETIPWGKACRWLHRATDQ